MSSGLNTEKFIEDIFEQPIIWNRNCASNKSLTESTWIEMSRKYATSVSQLKSKWKGLRDMFRVEIKRIPRNEAGELIIQPHEYESKWTHYRSLLFLADHMRSRNVKCTSIDPIQKMEVFSYSYGSNGFNGSERETDAHDAHDAHDATTVKQETFDMPVKKLNNKRKNSESASSSMNAVNPLSSPEIQQPTLMKKRLINATAMDLLTGADAPDMADRIINDDYHFLLSLQPFMAELSPIQKLRLRMKIQKLVFEELYANENLL